MNQLFNHQDEASGPVECLGQTFPSDEARREHFLKLLAEKLRDPEFRKQEGFPVGTDEAILEMSDPPYYTACPNPWLKDFVEHYGSEYDQTAEYSREPLAIDVSVGKLMGYIGLTATTLKYPTSPLHLQFSTIRALVT